MIKIASLEDFPIASELGVKFALESHFSKHVDTNTVETLVYNLISSPNSVFILCENIGMVCGTITPFLLGTKTMAVELGWYIVPEHRTSGIGGELYTAFEDWAKSQSCDLITMMSIDDTLGKFYEKRGYSLYERTYMKELNNGSN